ncbi:glycosyltransferase family 20-domain-containing protein [Obelidium mucronatum]|nr:glycosyltransferase family 20-domain-containing protein [Obelidium mucronatum]
MPTRTLVVSLFLPLTATAAAPAATQTQSTSPTSDALSNRPVASVLRTRRLSGATLPANAPTPESISIEISGLGNIGLQNAVESVRTESLSNHHASFSDVAIPEPTTSSSSTIPCLNASILVLSQCFPRIIGRMILKLAVSKALLNHSRSCLAVFLTEEEIDGHYNQFCKQVLWRPFHYQLPDYPKGQAFEERAWKQYVAVNQKFADVIIANHQPTDIVWVNDYHLMLVPQMVRQALPDATIGFFLHIPFPSSEIFRCLPVRKQILEGILGADLVGFQTYSFLRHFLMTCTRLLSLDSTPRGIQLENKAVKVGIFPIGINVDSLNTKRNQSEVHEMIFSLREKYAGKKVLIGRDKNDLVKGVRQKMLAFELFLEERKEFQSKVVLIQVALSTTEENENETQVNEIVSRINSKFGTIEYVPVVYLQQNISFSHYLALLSIADACLITSLRDGMNLTSHEYVVCQEEKMSPLIISEFAGTYSSLGAALRVNPWDTQEVADAIYDALTMSEEEKASRWREMYAYVSTHTAQSYVQKFVNEIPRVHEELVRLETSHIPLLQPEIVLTAYQTSKKRIFFLDHDGTIAHHVPDTLCDEFVETEPSVVSLVKTLASNPQNLVYIMSGRRRKELIQFVGIPNVGLCAENGCFVLYANQQRWHTMLTDQDLSWRKQVVDIFDYYTDRTPGSSIQQNEISIIWHFGRADASFGTWQALECQNHIQNALGSQYPITLFAKKKKIEICPRNVNKGRILRRILEHHYQGKLSKRSSFPHPPPPTRAATIPAKGSFFNISVASDVANSKAERYASSGGLTDALTGSAGGAGIVVAPGIPQPPLPTTAASAAPPPPAAAASGSSNPSCFDFIMCIGDDRSDEHMFEYVHLLDSATSPAAKSDDGGDSSDVGGQVAAKPVVQSLQEAYQNVVGKSIFSVTVGSKSSSARWHVAGVDDVVEILGVLVQS